MARIPARATNVIGAARGLAFRPHIPAVPGNPSAGGGDGWKSQLQRASYNGIPFSTMVRTKTSGRREVEHEFAKEDTPYGEDMGRRGYRFQITGYVVGGQYIDHMMALMEQLETEGPGTLVHPTMGPISVIPGLYEVTERDERGRMAEFVMNFVEAGSQDSTSPTDDTSGQVGDAAQPAADATSGTLDASTGFSADGATAAPGTQFGSPAVNSSMSDYAPSGLAVPPTFSGVGQSAPS